MDKSKLDTMRHSCAHLIAAAVRELYPSARFGVGPIVENGFYYDIDFGKTIKEEDLQAIEKKANELLAQDLKFIRQEMNLEEALELFNKLEQEYKVELLKDIREHGTTNMKEFDADMFEQASEKKVTVYQTGNFLDLCRGPHVESAKEIGVFRLTKLAGAYWRGDQNNKQLQRIYGVCFETRNELDEYFKMIEEAEKRDHRKLGKELDLFHIDEVVGSGLPLWHPKGAILWRVIEDFWYQEHLRSGYDLVRSPHIGNRVLWETSGHWGFYNESMYPPLEVGQTLKENQDKAAVQESEQYLLKPMNCPFHIQIYKNRIRSYRDLPFRWAECGTVYRFEKKGELSGLVRVRGFTQDDAHIICRADQVEEELKRVIDFILFIFRSFGFDIRDIRVYLSVRDPNSTKYAGNEDGWRFTEEVLEKVAREKELACSKDIGGAVFYGPKLDFKIQDCLKREWQCSTLQFDFNLPARFQLNYMNNEGKEEQPYMLHRALFGSFERFIGLLIEHYAGAFPVWLAPIQIVFATVSQKHIEGAKELAWRFQEHGVRVEVDDADETVGNKIRKTSELKVPYIIVIGDKELQGENLTIRKRQEEKQFELSKQEFLQNILQEIQERK